MNAIRLARYFYSRRYMQEAVLIVQLVLMFVLSMVVFSPVDAFLQFAWEIKGAYAAVDDSRTLFFNPNEAVYYNGTGIIDPESAGFVDAAAKDALASAGIAGPMRMALCPAYIDAGTENEPEEDSQDQPAVRNLLVYSAEMLEATGLFSGEGAPSPEQRGAVPILISPSLAGLIPLGSETTVTLRDGDTGIPCVVAGVLSEEAVLPACHGFGSFPTLSCFGTKLSDYPGTDFIVMGYDPAYFPEIQWESSFLVPLEENADVAATVQALNAQVGAWGSFATMGELEKVAFSRVFVNNSMAILEFLLLSLLAFFGYGGYLFLMTFQRQQEFSVFFLLGMTRRKMLVLNCVFGCVNLLIALLIAYASYPWFRQLLGSGSSATATVGVVGLSYCFGLLLLALIFSFLSAFHRFGNVSTIFLLQGGD